MFAVFEIDLYLSSPLPRDSWDRLKHSSSWLWWGINNIFRSSSRNDENISKINKYTRLVPCMARVALTLALLDLKKNSKCINKTVLFFFEISTKTDSTAAFERVKQPPMWKVFVFPPLWSRWRHREFPEGRRPVRCHLHNQYSFIPTNQQHLQFSGLMRGCDCSPCWGSVNGS